MGMTEQQLKEIAVCEMRTLGYAGGVDEGFQLIKRFLAALPKPEPVAVIGSGWTICFAGAGPIAPIVRKHNLKIGDALYTEAPIAPPASEQKPAEWDQDAAIEALIDFAPRSSLQAEMIEQVSFDPTSGPVYALTTQGRALLDQLKVAFFAAVPQPDYKAQRDALLEALERQVADDEQFAFEEWLDAESPSGDVESAQRQWEESFNYSEFLEDTEKLRAAIASVKGGA